MSLITIDHLSNVVIDDAAGFNERGTMRYLSAGILRLANLVDRRESGFRAQMPKGMKVWSFGIDLDDSRDHLDEIACFFHWFGVSVCNYARLVGFLSALHSPGSQLSRKDLQSDVGKKAIKKAVNSYVDQIPELQSVLTWRHKVAAHFAITDPRSDDNVATLDMSVMFPVCFSGDRYRVGELKLTVTRGTNPPETSAIPCWSLTEVFESLLPRYWPNVRRESPAESTPIAATPPQ